MKNYIVGYDTFQTPTRSFQHLCIFKVQDDVHKIVASSSNEIVIKVVLFLAWLFKVSVFKLKD